MVHNALLSVKLSVCLLALSQLNRLTFIIMVMKFGTGIDLDKILDLFVGQGHKSKAKVIQFKNVIFRVSAWVFCVINGMKISCALCTELCACTIFACVKSQIR